MTVSAHSRREAHTSLGALTLEEAIQQQISLGQKDPLEIARKVEELYGGEWMAEQLLAYREDLVASMARMRLGTIRRSAEVALRPGDQVTSNELKLAAFWVPDEHGGQWKRAADVTPEDLDARAKHYVRLAVGSLVRAEWLRQVAALMRAEGAKKLGQLKVALPPLPDGDDDALGELVAG